MQDKHPNLKVLLTGANGMIGSYVRKEFSECSIVTLGRGDDNDLQVDLSRQSPLVNDNFELVIHCSGTALEKNADAVNRIGTQNLLKALEKRPPKYVVFISSLSVYGLAEGNEITEESPLNPVTNYGKSKLAAEDSLRTWCAEKGVILTVLRPALTFGNGISGKGAAMFEAVARGRYFHVRGNEARRSVVMANDVATACRLLYKEGGIYNVTDGRNPTVIKLGDAMAAHCGSDKRIAYCPYGVLKWCARFGDIIPGLSRFVSTAKLNVLMSSLTFSNRKIVDKTGIKFYDTVEVIARRSIDYPYEFND